MKLFFQVGLTANQAVQGFFFPNVSRGTGGPVDVMGAGRFDALKNTTQGPEHRLPIFVLLLDLRFKKQMNVVRHDTRGIKLNLTVFVSVKNALQHKITLRRRQLASFVRGK